MFTYCYTIFILQNEVRIKPFLLNFVIFFILEKVYILLICLR